jgi:hypothetical protein
MFITLVALFAAMVTVPVPTVPFAYILTALVLDVLFATSETDLPAPLEFTKMSPEVLSTVLLSRLNIEIVPVLVLFAQRFIVPVPPPFAAMVTVPAVEPFAAMFNVPVAPFEKTDTELPDPCALTIIFPTVLVIVLSFLLNTEIVPVLVLLAQRFIVPVPPPFAAMVTVPAVEPFAAIVSVLLAPLV